MARGKKHTPEQVVNLSRQVEVAVANRKTTAVACKEAEITEQTYYRWRKEYGGLQVDQARRLKELEQENTKLKRLVSELSLEKLVLKDMATRTPPQEYKNRMLAVALRRCLLPVNIEVSCVHS
jgi:putative transposase